MVVANNLLYTTAISSPQITVEYTVTQDEVAIAIARYARPGSPVVVLMHGFAQNYRMWDFPIAQHNFARYLYQRGYDVWLPSLRGHGTETAHSSDSKPQDNIDTLAIYDIPAIVQHIKIATRQPLLWIGHSMGGMLALMYLQGATYTQTTQYGAVANQTTQYGAGANQTTQYGAGANQTTQCGAVANQYATLAQTTQFSAIHQSSPYHITNNQSRIVFSDPQLAQQRQADFRGLILLGTPVQLTWNANDLDTSFKLGFWQSNKIFPWMANMKTLRSLTGQLPYIPTASLLNLVQNKQESASHSWLKKITRWSVSQVANSFLASLFWYPPNMNRELIDHLLNATLNNIIPGVLEQFADWVNHQTFRAFPSDQAHTNPHIYSDHFDLIKLPLLMITGNRDKIAPDKLGYHKGFLKIASIDKSYHCIEEFGHNDLCVGRYARQQVYPLIENWIREHL